MQRKRIEKSATTNRSQRKTYHATMHVVRIEEWCVEADSADEARALLAAGQGHRCTAGDCIGVELHSLHDE